MDSPESRLRDAAQAELGRRLLLALQSEWRLASSLYFRNQLKPPAFELSDATTFLGRWDATSRTLSIQREFALRQPWPQVREVLKHEMAHQYVHEALGIMDESAHGPAFRTVCKAHGFDAAARGLPLSPEGEDDLRILRKVEKLLSLAQSPNPHEAQSAMHAAQQLLAQYNLSAPLASDYSVRWLGTPRTRMFAHEKLLGGLLTEHFLVAGIYVQAFIPSTAKTGLVLEICGPRANVEIAAYVFDFMQRTAERLWQEDKVARNDRSDRERLTFLAAVMAGFREKLGRDQTLESKRALVHVKHAGLDDFIDTRFPRRRTMGGAQWNDSEAAQRGRQAGQRVVVQKGVEEGSQSRGRLLGR